MFAITEKRFGDLWQIDPVECLGFLDLRGKTVEGGERLPAMMRLLLLL